MGKKSAFFGDRTSIIYLTKNVCPISRFNSDVAGELWRGLQNNGPAEAPDLLAVVGTVMDMGDVSVVHDLVDGHSADGFVIWCASCNDNAYFSRFSDRPVVCLTTPHLSFPLVSIPSRSGILDLMQHLVEIHGFSKIAFLGGPEQHPSARERFSAYLDGLHEHGLVMNPRLVIPVGTWEFSWGMDCVHTLLDERGLVPGRDIEAIICSADQVSMGVISELIRRKISVPGQIAVTGYNNAPIASSSSLTTIDPPFQRQARQAYALLMQQMEMAAEVVMADDPLQPVMRVGQSCGCGEQHYLHLDPERLGDLSAMLSEHLHQWLTRPVAQAQAHKILEAFAVVMTGGANLSHVLDCITPHLQTGRFYSQEQAFWQVFFACYRAQMQSAQPFAEAILNQIHKNIENHLRQMLWFNTARENQITDLFFRLGIELSLARGLDELLASVRRELGRLDIHSCWIVSYQTPVDGRYAPVRGRLVLAMEGGQTHSVPEDGLEFELADIVPQGYRCGSVPGAFILFPLRFGPHEYGYAIFNNSESFPFYAAFASTIASGMHNLAIDTARTVLADGESILADYSQRWFGADSLMLRQRARAKTF